MLLLSGSGAKFRNGWKVLGTYFLKAGGVQLSLVNDLHSYLDVRQKPKITSLIRLKPGPDANFLHWISYF